MGDSLNNSTDEQLAVKIAQRDSLAFAEMYDRYGARMYRYFLRMLWRDAAKAEDFTQDLFLKIIEKAHAYRQESSFKTWIYTLAANMCKNEYRRLSNREKVNLNMPDLLDVSMSDMIEQDILISEIRKYIDQLDPHFRTCFVLRYQEELSVSEISIVIGCPEGTVKSRLHRALQKLSSEILKAGITN